MGRRIRVFVVSVLRDAFIKAGRRDVRRVWSVPGHTRLSPRVHRSALLLTLVGGCRAHTTQNTLRGTVTDPSGSSVPAALVQVLGPGGEKRQATGSDGGYSFPNLAAGKYRIRFIAKGFAVGQKEDVEIAGSATIDYQFAIEAAAQ